MPLAHLAAEGYVQSGSGSPTLTVKETRATSGKPVAATTAMLHTQLKTLLPSAEWKLLEILIRRKGKAVEPIYATLVSEDGYSTPSLAALLGRWRD